MRNNSEVTADRLAKLPQWAIDYFEKKFRSLETIAALRWTDETTADVPPPRTDSTVRNELSRGYAVVGSGMYGRVEPVCSSCMQPIWLHSTKLRALKAHRNQIEQECASQLLKIDKQIESEIACSRTPK